MAALVESPTVKHKLITAERIKIGISILAVIFLAIDAWQTKNVGSVGWMLLCVIWVWPEKEDEKKS